MTKRIISWSLIQKEKYTREAEQNEAGYLLGSFRRLPQLGFSHIEEENPWSWKIKHKNIFDFNSEIYDEFFRWFNSPENRDKTPSELFLQCYHGPIIDRKKIPLEECIKE